MKTNQETAYLKTLQYHFGYVPNGCSIIPQGQVLNCVHSNIICSELGPENIPSTEEWTKKWWFIYTMEYYTVGKINYIMKFLCKYMDLENIIKECVNPDPERKI